MSKKVIGVNEKGYRIGEFHPRKKLTDHDVDLIRSLREDDNMPYLTIAEKFEVAVRTVRDICDYKIRVQTPSRYKEVLDV